MSPAVQNPTSVVSQEMQERQNSNEFGVVLLTGRRICVTCDEVNRIFLHPWVLAIYSGLSLLTVAMNEQPWTQGMPVWERTAIYFLSSVVGLFGAWAVLMMLARACLRGMIRNVHSIIFDFSGAFMSLFTTYCLVVLSGRPPALSSLPSILLYVFYIVIIVHTSLVLWSVLIPRMLSHMRGFGEIERKASTHLQSYEENRRIAPSQKDEHRSNTDHAHQAIFVVVGGKRILAADISHLSAQGNYVKIFTDVTNYFVAGSLQEVIGQLPDDIGLRVHRSHWISYKAIKEIIPNGRGLAVILNSGIEVPVSRNNQNSVKQLKLPPN